MAELTIEQKAEAYDFSLKRAKKLQETCDSQAVVGWCEYIFPELKESEDEKIRKWLIAQLELKSDVNNSRELELMILKSIAWLEKQGETFTKKDVDDAWLKGMCDAKHELEKQGKQKSAWSEEDNKNLEEIIWYVEKGGKLIFAKIDELVSWLKALKDRVQPKQEWSEEGETRIKNILSVLDAQVCWDGATGKKGNPYQKEIDWLESLRLQKQWKPNEEQIMCLQDALSDYHRRGYKAETLETLLEQLKQL